MPKSRKVIVFVVEGPSDETAWALVFKKIFDQMEVVFDVMHTDIFTVGMHRRGDTVLNELRNSIKIHAQKQHYAWTDILKVVVLTDTDGAFIPESAVVSSSGLGLEYHEDWIEAPDPEFIRERNKLKKRGIDILRSKGSLTNEGKLVPLEVYYLSRNLEHVLHGKADDVSDVEKRELSHDFRRRYANNISGFRQFISSSDFVVSDSYEETWDFIKSGTNSLKRYSNVHLLI